MQITKLYINGYKNLNKLEVLFGNNSSNCIIIGENGSGKTNIIEAIVIIFSLMKKILNGESSKPIFEFLIEYTIDEKKLAFPVKVK